MLCLAQKERSLGRERERRLSQYKNLAHSAFLMLTACSGTGPENAMKLKIH